MRKKYFYGIKRIEFIYHGDWSDPELIYKGHSFNYYDLENALVEDYKYSDDSKNDDNFKNFPKWVKENEYLAFNYLDSLLEGGYFYE